MKSKYRTVESCGFKSNWRKCLNQWRMKTKVTFHSHTHLVRPALRWGFLGRHGPLVIMGNREHAGLHKGVLSVACMLDLCRVSTLLYAPWPLSDLGSLRRPEVKSRCLRLISPQLGYPSKSALKFGLRPLKATTTSTHNWVPKKYTLQV